MEIPIKIQKPVSSQGQPEVYLQQKSFDSLINRFGYDVYLDRIIPCPCKEEGVNSARLTCRNCYGTGFVLAERIQTKAWIHSMNYPTNYKDWSIENVGTAQISTLSNNPVNFMDRIILYKETNSYSELIYPIESEETGEVIAFCAYPPTEIEFCKIFQGEENPLQDISIEDIEIDNEGKIILTKIKDILYKRTEFIYNSKTALSISYKYHPSYHIIDIIRNLITSPTDSPSFENLAKGTRVNFPYSAVGKMSHLVLERSNLMNLPEGYMNNFGYSSTSILDLFNNKNISKEFCYTELSKKRVVLVTVIG